jgi:LysM repeat protein
MIYRYIALFFIFLTFITSSAFAVRNRLSYEEDKSIILREILDGLDNLRHEVNNHEAEIRMFEEKYKNQEDILDSLRNQVSNTLQAVKETLRNQSSTIEAKISSHENAAKGLTNDFKAYSTDYAQILNDYKKRIIELEKTIEIQNRNIENLQAAMQSLMEVLQVKEPAQAAPQTPPQTVSEGSSKVYRVKAGDSLEKIAKQNQTTIKKLKEANPQLTSDQIIVGQKLKLPEP